MWMETFTSHALVLPWVLVSCSIPFFAVWNVRVKGPRITCQNHLHSRTHTRLQIFFSIRIPGYFGVWKEASADYYRKLLENFEKTEGMEIFL